MPAVLGQAFPYSGLQAIAAVGQSVLAMLAIWRIMQQQAET